MYMRCCVLLACEGRGAGGSGSEGGDRVCESRSPRGSAAALIICRVVQYSASTTCSLSRIHSDTDSLTRLSADTRNTVRDRLPCAAYWNNIPKVTRKPKGNIRNPKGNMHGQRPTVGRALTATVGECTWLLVQCIGSEHALRIWYEHCEYSKYRGYCEYARYCEYANEYCVYCCAARYCVCE